MTTTTKPEPLSADLVFDPGAPIVKSAPAPIAEVAAAPTVESADIGSPRLMPIESCVLSVVGTIVLNGSAVLVGAEPVVAALIAALWLVCSAILIAAQCSSQRSRIDDGVE